MTLPTTAHRLSTMLIRGHCGIVGLLLTMLPSAWGQLVPIADSRLPGQPMPEENRTLASTADRSRLLIAFHRDKQELGVIHPDHPRQSLTPPSHGEPGMVRQRETQIHNPSVVPPVHVAAPSGLSAEIPKRIPPSPEVATDKLATHAQRNLNDPRRLLPSTNGNSSIHSENQPAIRTPLGDNRVNNNRASGIAGAFPSKDVLRTAGTGLGIALGLLLLCTWLFRRNMPSPTTPLPKEVVSVLGRAQLATRQFVQLLQVGNKLVLVSVTPEGTEPITEITDPMEVDRLLGLCMRNHTQSTTAEFQQVLNQLSREGAKGFLEKSGQ